MTKSVKQTLKVKLDNHLQAAWDSIEEFCLNSGIGGLRYCVDRSRHWFERIWWLLVVALSFSVCGYMIVELLQNRSMHPVTVIYDDEITTIRSIPFPAITICPPVKISVDAFNLTEFIDKHKLPNSQANIPPEEGKRFNAALHICKSHLRDEFYSSESIKTDSSLYEYIDKIALSRSKMFESCAWVANKFDCDQFHTHLIERGQCFTFNMLNSRSIYSNITAPEFIKSKENSPNEGNWSLERELLSIGLPRENQPSSVLPSYPRYIERLHDIETLSLILNFNFHNYPWNDICDRLDITSFKVFVHRNDEPKRTFDRPIEIGIGKKNGIYITPKVITASKEVQKYAPHLRRCYFTSERQLKYFKIYTKSSCELECLSEFVKKECGCVKFSMPRETSTKICGPNERKCYGIAVRKHRENRILTNKIESDDKCNCLQTCVDMNFEAEVSELQYIYDGSNENSNTTTVSTLVTISFKDNDFLALKREELYTNTNIVSTCGGLLSLFMGISLLSIAEIIYHCTIGYGCKLSTYKSKISEKRTNHTQIHKRIKY